MILVIFLISSIQYSFALGVSPARNIVEFESNLEGSEDLNIINSGNKDMKVFIYVEGELEEKVFLSNYELEFSSSDEAKTVSYIYKLPNKFEEPGPHKTNIVIREVPLNLANEGTMVGGSVAVIHDFRVDVPYPGKYATAEIKIAETDKENEVHFIIPVNNLGTQKIMNAKGIIDIYGPTNELITTVNTNLDSVEPGLRKDLTAIWKEDSINSGKYYAKLTLTYDGDVTEAERVFDFGKLLIEIIDINVKNFRLGDIAKFNILVENRWADLVEDVYAELVVSEDGAEIGRIKSASEDITSLSKQELTAFWDTAGVKEGEYGAKAILYYGEEQSVEKDMKAFISLNSIRFDVFGTGAVVGDGGGFDRNDIIVVALVVLVAINVGWFFYFRKKKK
jgi:hypothetical protein